MLQNGPQKIRDVLSDKAGKQTQSLWLVDTEYYLVSRVIALDHGGWETMIFRSDKEGEVIDWGEVYGTRQYESHSKSIKNWQLDPCLYELDHD